MERLLNRQQLIEETTHPEYICAEVGVGKGDLTFYLIVYVDEIIAIDDWQEDLVFFEDGEWVTWEAERVEKYYREKYGDILTIKPSLKKLPDKSLDWIYLDKHQNFENALNDLETASQKTKKWICGHDYCDICNFGIVRAVSVFCDRHNLEITYLTQEPELPVCGENRKVAYQSYGIKLK